MDQAKVYLALLKKHHFWVMCGVIFITSIVVYSMGTTELDNQRKAREGAITTAKSNQEKILNGFQPNPKTIQAYLDKNKEVARGVEEAWVKLYWAQRARLTWPSDMATFKEDLDKWPEMIPPKPFDEDQRRTYQTVMTQPGERNRLKKLIQIYQETKVPNARKGMVHETEVRPPTKGSLPGKTGPQEEFTIVPVGLVRWGSPTTDQTGMSSTGIDLIFREYKWVEKTTPPTSLEMRYTQEDLWVYEFILEALAKINAGIDVTRPEKALLKEISDFRIGQQAIVAPTTNIVGDLMNIVGAVGATGTEGQPGVPPGYPAGPPMSNEANRMGGPMGPPGQPGAMAAMNADDALKNGRYCDLDMKPIQASEFAEKIEKDQYRLMPVYLRLILNQQKLPQLMTELSTAVMPMRIKQIQLYKTDATPPASPVSATGQPTGPSVDPRFSMDVGVEIRGFVHIYQIPATKDFPHRSDPQAGAAGAPAPATGAPVAHPTDPTAAPTVIVPGGVPTVTVPPAVGVPAQVPPAGVPAPGTPAATPNPDDAEAPAPAPGGAPPAGAAPKAPADAAGNN